MSIKPIHRRRQIVTENIGCWCALFSVHVNEFLWTRAAMRGTEAQV
jgi:hypothetical protein